MKNQMKRTIGGVTVLLFVTTNVLFAHSPETALWKQRRQAQTLQLAQLPAAMGSFALPPAMPLPLIQRPALAPTTSLLTLSPLYGTLRPVSAGKTGAPTIIHIQDVHMNLEAQRNMGKALEELLNKKKVGLLALEGAFEPVDLSRIRRFPNPETIQVVSDYLLAKNRITGPIHTALTTHADLPFIMGVDNSPAYKGNIEAYKTSVSRQSSLKKTLTQEAQALQIKKAQILNPALQAFDSAVVKYQKETLSFGDYARTLSQHTTDMSPRLEILLEALKLESSLNFGQVEKERTRVLSELTQKLSKEETNQLFSESLAFRTGAVSYGQFYTSFRQLCSNHGINLRRTPALDDYIRYVLLSDGVKVEEILAEMRALEEAAYVSLIKTSEEKSLISQSRHNYLAGKLADFALTAEEWNEYKAVIASGAKQSHEIASPSGLAMTPFEAFYLAAEKRDHLMTQNLLQAMDQQKASVAVLVTGGFHSQGIDAKLQEKGLNVFSFTPRITKIDSSKGSEYLSVFTQEKTPLAQLFEGDKLFVSPPVWTGDHNAQVGSLATMRQIALLKGEVTELQATQMLQDVTGETQEVEDIETTDSRVTLETNDVTLEADIDPKGNITDDDQSLNPKSKRLTAISSVLWIAVGFTLIFAPFADEISAFQVLMIKLFCYSFVILFIAWVLPGSEEKRKQLLPTVYHVSMMILFSFTLLGAILGQTSFGAAYAMAMAFGLSTEIALFRAHTISGQLIKEFETVTDIQGDHIAENRWGRLTGVNKGYMRDLPLSFQRYYLFRETIFLQKIPFAGDYLVHLIIDPAIVLCAATYEGSKWYLEYRRNEAKKNREFKASRWDINRSINKLFERQVRMEPPFFQIVNDGQSIENHTHAFPGKTHQFVHKLINLKRMLRPGGGGISKTCFICLEAVKEKFPNELWLRFGKLVLYFNPQPVWAPTLGKPAKDQPHHMTMTWREGHRSQREIIEMDVLRVFRAAWIKLNASPSLIGRQGYQMGFNGISYRDNDPQDEYGAGASQDHVHAHLVRTPYAFTNAPIQWESTSMPDLPNVKIGEAKVIPSFGGENGKIVLAFEAQGWKNSRQLDLAVHRAGKLITEGVISGHKDSLNMYYFDPGTPLLIKALNAIPGMKFILPAILQPKVRVFMTGRVLRYPPGFNQGWGHHEILAGMWAIVSKPGFFYALTDDQKEQWEKAQTTEDKFSLLNSWKSRNNHLPLLSAEESACKYRDAFKAVTYSPAQIQNLINKLTTREKTNRTPELDLARTVAQIYSGQMNASQGIEELLKTQAANLQIQTAFGRATTESEFNVGLFLNELEDQMRPVLQSSTVSPERKIQIIKDLVRAGVNPAKLREADLIVKPIREIKEGETLSNQIETIIDGHKTAQAADNQRKTVLVIPQSFSHEKELIQAVAGIEGLSIEEDGTGVFSDDSTPRLVFAGLERLLETKGYLEEATSIAILLTGFERGYEGLNPGSRLLEALIQTADGVYPFLGLAVIDKVEALIKSAA